MQWNGIALLRVTGEVCYTLRVHCSLIQGLIQFPTAACAGTSGAGVSLPSECLITAGSPQPAGPNGALWGWAACGCRGNRTCPSVPRGYERFCRHSWMWPVPAALGSTWLSSPNEALATFPVAFIVKMCINLRKRFMAELVWARPSRVKLNPALRYGDVRPGSECKANWGGPNSAVRSNEISKARPAEWAPCTAFPASSPTDIASQRPMADPAKRVEDYLRISLEWIQRTGRWSDSWFRLKARSVMKWQKQTSHFWHQRWIRSRWLELSRVYLYSWLHPLDASIIQSFPIWELFMSFRMKLIPLLGSWNKASPLHKRGPWA